MQLRYKLFRDLDNRKIVSYALHYKVGSDEYYNWLQYQGMFDIVPFLVTQERLFSVIIKELKGSIINIKGTAVDDTDSLIGLNNLIDTNSSEYGLNLTYERMSILKPYFENVEVHELTMLDKYNNTWVLTSGGTVYVTADDFNTVKELLPKVVDDLSKEYFKN